MRNVADARHQADTNLISGPGVDQLMEGGSFTKVRRPILIVSRTPLLMSS